MTGNDRIFTALMLCSLLLVGGIITSNATSALSSGPAQTAGIPPAPKTQESDPAQTQTITEKFEKMGLPLHEGKYWIRP